jgi:signal transduction histidine kinase
MIRNAVPFTAYTSGRDDDVDFLAGAGEMGELIRAHDWAATPLGVPAKWPRSLRNALRLVLAAAHPMAILWGRDLIHFCNSACARLLGEVGQRRLIGASIRELNDDVRRRMLGPALDEVMQRGMSSVVEDHFICVFRNGRAEETYLTSQLDPLLDDTGVVGGVLTTLTETTDRVINARRTAALRGLASVAAGARSVEEACQRALGEMARHATDIPFALLYRREAGGACVRLAAAAGLPARTAASPESIELGAGPVAPGWPVADAMTTDDAVTVDDLATRFGTLPSGDWPLAPRIAVIMPLTPPGCAQPDAALIVGVSARRALDADYRGFIELVGRQVTGAIAAGRAYEEERRHAAAAKRGRARRRARERALESRFAGVLEERSRMAREIHDTLLQGVTGIALQLRAMIPRVRTNPEPAADALQAIVELAEKTARDARQAVWEMRSPALAQAGLPAALEQAARLAATPMGVVLRFSVRGSARRLQPVVEDTIFRVGHEAVTNALKHASAHSIGVSMAYDRSAVRLAVADDGRGFAAGSEPRSFAGHWGLLGMRERAERVGASLIIDSTEGAGTTVELIVPARTLTLES